MIKIRKNIILISLLAVSILWLEGCSSHLEKTLDEVAYTSNTGENLIFIRENDVLTPYIILSDDYNGFCLLLRKEILQDSYSFNDYSSYYKDSKIDRFLNNEFYNSLNIKKSIVSTPIKITKESSIAYSENETETIDRKVFLLSLTEIGVNDTVNSGHEGENLSYFSNLENRIAYQDGIASSWWLRSPNTYYSSLVYAVGADGTIGAGNAFDKNGVRPCFCISSSMEISKYFDPNSNQNIFVLE